MFQTLGIIGGLLALLGVFPYVSDILKRKVKPQRATFFIWSVLGLIAVFSQFAKGASNSLWLPSLETLGSLVIFLLSIPYGVGGFGKRDYITLSIAVFGLVVWYFTKEAVIALYLVILVDAAGLYLELHKTYLHPETETYTAWVFAAIGGVFTALAVGNWSFILLSYPIYIILANTAVVVAIQMGLQRKRRK
jgi:hypothetical protein